MSHSGAFLGADEYEEFQKPDRCRPRSIAEVALEPTSDPPPTAQRLVSHILSRLQSLIRRDSQWSECVCVRVKEGDGMTWSAEAVHAAVAESHSQFHRWCLADRMTPDSMPLIANFIGVRKFLKLAADHKLTTGFITLRSWMTPAIIASAVVIAATIKLLEVLLRAQTQDLSQLAVQFTDYKLYIVSIGLALLGLILQQLTTLLTTRTKAKSIEKFLQELREKEHTHPYADFIEKVASQLCLVGFPSRFVIIDNYESLDYTTAKVIERYFRSHLRNATGSEFWLIFEKEDGEKFSNKALDGTYSSATIKLFEQAWLTEEERLDLARIIGKPEAAQFSSVKAICHAPGKGQQWLDTLYREYRLSHPKDEKRYGNLEFFYLLSLTATAGEIFLRHREIVGKFAETRHLRTDVLKQFLRGTALTVGEFRTCLTEIAMDFKSALVTEGSGELAALRTTPEAAEVLETRADELELPSARLGHLYWALYWHDELQNRPVQAFWIRKLVFHVLAADPSWMKDNLDKLVPRLLEIALFAIDGCLKTCIFQDVQRLLQQAVDLLHSDALSDSVSYQRGLLRRCWEAYWMLGEEDILKLVLDIYAISGAAFAREAREADPLEMLFFESMPLLPGSRAQLQAAADRWAGGRPEASETIFDYARARSAWLALTVAPHLEDLGVTALLRAALESIMSVDALVQRAWERSIAVLENSAPADGPARRVLDRSESSTSARLTDVMTLSAAMWCAALRCNQAVSYALVASGAAGARLVAMMQALGHEPNQIVEGGSSTDAFQRLLDMAGNAVLLANDLRAGATNRAEGLEATDFPMSGLARELCAVSIASIVAAHHYRAKRGVPHPNQQVLGQIRSIITEINHVLDTSLPSVEVVEDLASPSLRKEIDTLMRACAIMWHAFGLQRLRDFMSIRRIHFDAICTDLEPEDYPRYRKLLESVACLNEMDFTGLMANLVVADSLNKGKELAALYLHRVGTIALRGAFGRRLQWELSLVAIRHAYDFGYDLADFLAGVLEGSAGHGDGVSEFLSEVSLDVVRGHILRFLEASKRPGRPELTAQYRTSVAAFIAHIEAEDVRNELQSLLDVLLLEDRIDQGEQIDVANVMAQWQARRELWTYPWVLGHLLQKGYSSPDIGRECVRVLSRNPLADRSNTYFFLALFLATQRVRTKERKEEYGVATSYLRQSIGKWADNMPADTNVQVYWVLEELEPGRRELYHSERTKWELLNQERKHAQQLPELLQDGKYFAVFKDYWDTMTPWGLSTESPAEVHKRLNISQESMRHAVREWKNAGGVVPSPWVGASGQRVVSAQYLYLGHYIFSVPSETTLMLDEDRQRFNQAACNALPTLLKLIDELPQLPPAIKELVASFFRRFLAHTAPDSGRLVASRNR